MGTVEKFLFETAFDDLGPVDAAEAGEEEVIEPTFTQDQLDAARNEGLAAGKQEGIKQAAEETERLTAQALQTISDQMAELTQNQEQARADAVEGSMAIAAAITRKLFPELERRHSLDEVNRLVEGTISRLMEETRITVHVSETLHEKITEGLQTLVISKGYEGQLVVLEDKELALGDCRIDWSNGNALRDTAAIWRSIEGVIERNIGEGFLDLVDTGKPNGDLTKDGEDNPFDYVGIDPDRQAGENDGQEELPLQDAAEEPITAEDTLSADKAGDLEVDHTETEVESDSSAQMDPPPQTDASPAADDLENGNS